MSTIAKSNCLLAIDPILKQIEENKRLLLEWNSGKAAHNIKERQYADWQNTNDNLNAVKNTRNNIYEKKLNDHYNWLKKQRKTTPKCASPKRRDETHCQKSFGNFWEMDSSTGSGCTWAWNRKLICKMTKDYMQGQISDKKSKIAPKNPGSYPAGPTSIITTAITCCEQIFSDIKVNGGDLDIDAVQKCSAKLKVDGKTSIGKKVGGDSGGGSVKSGESGGGSGGGSGKSGESGDDNTNWWLFGGGTTGVSSSSSSLCCSILIILIIMIM
jgi:hypothetical protein